MKILRIAAVRSSDGTRRTGGTEPKKRRGWPLGASPRVAAQDERIQRGHAHALAVGRVEAPRQPFVVIDVPVRTMSGTDTLWELHRER
jgi:hypothetical protein